MLWSENLGGGTFDAARNLTLWALRATGVCAADLDGDGDLDAASASAGDNQITWYENLPPKGPLGSTYCDPANLNSTGLPGEIALYGSDAAADNDVVAIASQLPVGQTSYLLASTAQGSSVPPGSEGVLCLGGKIARFRFLGQVVQGPYGSLFVDIAHVPTSPPVAVQPGQTWNFQFWYRDHDPLATSNLTNAVSITFL